MRTLKKALSLVLVLAMVLSLGVSAFAVEKAADYSDYADVKNTEAVTVLTAIGVLEGNTDGTFGPEGAFTRAAAAKIIAYMTLGATIADALPAGATEFSDVPASHWASKYIQYCANQGIIGGNGDGTFAPEGVLTATAWAKMLLCALGYDADKDGMTGNGWELNVTSLAMNAGIASAEDMVGTFNRDAAAKLAFKGLFYSKTTETKEVYVIEGGNDADAVESTGISAVDGKAFDTFSEAYLVASNAKVTGETFTITKAEDPIKADSLAKKVFKLTSGTTNDTLGRSVTTYTSTLTSLKDMNVKVAAVADYVIEGKITEKALYTMLGYKACASTGADAYTWTLKTNGNAGVIANATKTGTGTYFANGDVTYVYVDNTAKTVKFYNVNTFVGEVKKVTAAADGVARFVTLTNGKTFTTENFAVKDVVLYTIGGDGNILSLNAAEVVTGTLSKIATGAETSYTVNGTAYKLSAKAVTGAGYTAANLGKEVSFYVDGQGNLIQNKSAAATDTNWIYVMANSAVKTGDYMTGAASTMDVYGVTNVAEAVTLTVEKIGGLAVTGGVNSKAGLYTYTKNTKGNYELMAVTGAAAYADITKGATKVAYNANASSAIMNSATQYIFITKETNTNNVKDVKVVTGNANVATIAKENAYIAAENGVAKYVFVTAPAAAVVTDTTKIVYLTNDSVTAGTETVEGSTVTTWTYASAWTVDGKMADGITTKTSGALSGLYYINDDGTVGSAITPSDSNKVITAINGNVITLDDGSSYNVTDKTAEIFAGAEDVELKVGQTVTYKTNASATSNLDIIVVTADQATHALTLVDNASGVTCTTTAYEVIGGTGVVNTIKVVVTKESGTWTADSAITMTIATVAGQAVTGTVTPTAATSTVTFTVTITAPSADQTVTVSGVAQA